MVKDLLKNYVFPVATLSGSIIGVGFLSLPYMASKVGIWTMLFYFLILLGLIITIHVIFGKVSLATPDFKRFPGFVGYYLGEWPKRFILVTNMLGSFGILLVYLIIGGEFLTTVLSPMLGGTTIIYTTAYFIAASLLVLFGVKIIARVELLTLGLLILAFLIIFLEGLPHIELANIFLPQPDLTFQDLFLPYGAIMFSLWGTGLIPEVEEMLRAKPYQARHDGRGKKHFKKIIVISLLIPAAVYVAFIVLILGITGANTTQSALIGLTNKLGLQIAAVALCMGIIATFNCFVSQGLLLKKTFMYDMNMHEFPAWVFACFTPFMLFLFGVNSFIPLISLIGGVLLSIEGILILLMYKKIGGKKEIIYPLMLVFVLVAWYSLFYSNF